MEIRVILQQLPNEDDPEGFAAFLKEWIESEYPSRRLRISVGYGDRFQIMVNGLENCEESWLVSGYYDRAASDYRLRRELHHPLPLLALPRPGSGTI